MKKKIIISMITIVGLILSFNKVKASEIYNGYYFNSNYYSDLNLTNAQGSDGLYGYIDIATATNWNQSYTYNYMYFTSRDLTQYKDGVIQFEYSLDLPQIRGTVSSTIYSPDYCDRWDWGTIDSYNNVIRWDCDRVSQGQDSTIYDNEYIMPIYSIKAFMLNGSGNDAVPCEVNQNTSRIVCPITAGRNDVHGMLIYTKVYYSNTTNSTYRFKLGKQLLLYKNSDTMINDSINQQTQEIINQNATYQDTAYEETNGTQEVNDYNNLENEIMNSLNFDVNETQQITFNPQASLWIWNIAERLRGINPSIVLLMTSILGIGIIKMVLNR